MTLVLGMAAMLAATQDVAWQKTWADGLKEAKAQKKLAVLVFANGSLKDSVRFEKETLTDPAVVLHLRKYVCVKVDPEGSDDDNKLWQENKMPRPPATFIYDPEGKLLTEIKSLNARIYAGALDAAGPAYQSKIVPARQALASDPNQADKWAMLGEAYLALDNAPESSKAFDKAGELYAKKGDKAAAIKTAQGQIERYYEKKWYAQARPACRRILELDPADESKQGAFAAWVIGMADCDDRKWNDAATGLEAACRKYKDAKILDKMMFTLGSAYMYSNDKASAIRIFEEMILKFPESESVNIARTQVDKLKK